MVMTRGTVMQLMLIGFFLFAVAVVIYAIADFFKKLSSKKGRAELKQEVTSNAKFIATDKDFHKGLAKEFRPLLILLGVLGIAGLLTLLGVGD